MASPTTIGPFPYFPLEFTKDGAINKPDQFAALVDALTKPTGNQVVTDLLVLSHGWNADIAEAEALYTTIGGRISAVLPTQNQACAAVRRRNVIVCGILWPSKKFDEKSLIPGGAAGLNNTSAADAAAAVDLLASFVDTPEAKKALGRARTRIPSLADSLDARDEFVRIVRAFMPHDANDEEPVIAEEFFTLGGDELLRRLSRPMPGAAPTDQGGAAGLGDWIGKAVDGARSLANLVTYYQMKTRAGDIGQGGVHDALQRIREQRSADGAQPLRIHLAGHSFGARLVTAAAAGAPGSAPLPVDSLTLMQAAFSHFAFAVAYDGVHDGFYRRVEADPRVRGVTAITFTAKDKAVGLAYPLASRIARQIAAALGDANDPYGGLGRNGAQKTPGTQVVAMQSVGTAYRFSPRGIYNLDANAIIGGHSDLGHDEVAYALISAIAAS